MAEHHLPEDLGQWPTDPYELLGIDHQISQREAKRAYVRLIRRYKPEHAPAEFQKLREAFDYIELQIEAREAHGDFFSDDDWGSSSSSKTSAADNEDTDSPQADSSADDSEAAEPAKTPKPSIFARLRRGGSTTPQEQCRKAWGAAKKGKEKEAYKKLVELAKKKEVAANACLRLYWLLTVSPELDTGRTPCDWLAVALRESRLTGPAMELYRREILAERREALSARCSELMKSAAEPGSTADLAELRWRALSYLHRPDVIVADLPQLRDRVVFDDEETWGRLLLMAMDQLAWFNDQPAIQKAFETCQSEVDSLSHLHNALDRELDRLDMLNELVRGWRKLRGAVGIPRHWNDLIPLSWTQQFPEIRDNLAPILTEIAEQPKQALQSFDKMTQASPAAASHLGSLFERACYDNPYYDEESREWDQMQQASKRFFQLNEWCYASCRTNLLQFCIEEAIDPQWLGQIADEANIRIIDGLSWSDSIRDDGSVRYVYSAYRAFWG